MDLALHGRTAIVTGASKGIGLATVRVLLDEGMDVVAVSRKTTSDLDDLIGDHCVHVAADLTDPAAPAHAVDAAVTRFGRLDLLVNNAGGPPPGVTLPRFGFLTPTDDDWREMIEFNLYSAVRAIRAAIPVLLANGGGSTVDVSPSRSPARSSSADPR